MFITNFGYHFYIEINSCKNFHFVRPAEQKIIYFSLLSFDFTLYMCLLLLFCLLLFITIYTL